MPDVFNWTPQVDPQGQTTFRVRSAQFGDGYTQSVGDGINNRVDSWPLSFEGDAAYVQPIKDFLDSHAGAQSFQWTPPLGAPALFRTVEIYAPSPLNEHALVRINDTFAFVPLFSADGAPGFTGTSFGETGLDALPPSMKLPWTFDGYVTI